MTGIIIQARMGSTRLPGKVLMKVGSKNLLQHIIDRLNLLQVSDCKIVVATSKEKSDDAVESFCNENAIACFRGDEKNVLNRFWMCTMQYGFDDIVRLTGDNPFVDITELERLIEMHRSCNADYSYSDTELPEGLGAEIFSKQALQKSIEKAYKDNHFEHVDDYILENRNHFICQKLELDTCKVHPEMQFTVDTKEQLEKACFIAEHAKDSFFGTLEAIRLEQLYQTTRNRKS